MGQWMKSLKIWVLIGVQWLRDITCQHFSLLISLSLHFLIGCSLIHIRLIRLPNKIHLIKWVCRMDWMSVSLGIVKTCIRQLLRRRVRLMSHKFWIIGSHRDLTLMRIMMIRKSYWSLDQASYCTIKIQINSSYKNMMVIRINLTQMKKKKNLTLINSRWRRNNRITS